MSDPATILIVDDEPGMRHALVRLMQTAGFGVLEAACGRDALEAVRRGRPDLVLLDVRLPDIDGLEVLKQIKSDPDLAETFVVHLTAQRSTPEYTKEGLRRGADGYLVQPIDGGELVARVQAFLRHKATMDQLKSSEARYRALFEGSPQPMWIYDAVTHRFITANAAALAHYGYRRDEFEQITLDDIVVGGKRPAEVQAGAVIRYEEQHRTKDERLIDVQVAEHHVQWWGNPGIVSLIFDVTARKQAERAREELIERCRREIRAMEELTRPAATAGQTDNQELPLSQRAPAVFSSGVASYSAILDSEVEERIYKVDHNNDEKLSALAARLAAARATPRDVVQLHFLALKERVPEPAVGRAQGFIEAGRITIVELMGYLAAAYREMAEPAPAK